MVTVAVTTLVAAVVAVAVAVLRLRGGRPEKHRDDEQAP